MEPNKLENQFREKLNPREINPSEAAWDRLDAMLSIAEKPKQKFTWLYIAASFIGSLLISTVFFNQKENTIDFKKNNIVIENPTQKDSSKPEIKNLKKELISPKTIIKQETKTLVQTQKNTKINVENEIIKAPEKVVAEIQPNNQNEPIAVNGKTSLENIDSLLASVEKPNLETKKAAIKINSTSLLNQVDGELQVSFREKAINTITKKYKEAKEALANRNNQ
ncbi:MAG: hypothetical protein JHC39_00055 [Lentimicrobium sp.]|jgi:hypothetical protein|nr:hypothetical protein [Lentimicrobium sp.]